MKKILSIFLACTFAVSCTGFAAHAKENDCAISEALKNAVGQYACSKLETWKQTENSCGIIELLGKFADKGFVLDILQKNSEDCSCPDEQKPELLPEQNPEEKPEQKPESTPEFPEDEKGQEDTTVGMTEVEKVVSLVNKYRAQNGLSPVEIDQTLSLAATKRAQETETLFSHTRPDGSSCFTVLSQYGVSYRGAGENIAMGQKDAEEVMTAWMNSDGHRANILGENFTKIGVGVHKGADGRLYWAQMFVY